MLDKIKQFFCQVKIVQKINMTFYAFPSKRIVTIENNGNALIHWSCETCNVIQCSISESLNLNPRLLWMHDGATAQMCLNDSGCYIYKMAVGSVSFEECNYLMLFQK